MKRKGSNMVEQLKAGQIPDYIRSIYKKNPFMADFFQVHIDEVRCGEAVVSIRTDPARHANHRGIIHGGVMAALADSVLGVTGASMGCVVVTVSMTIDYIKNTRPGETIRVESRVLHCGRSTMAIVAELHDEEDTLLGNMMATMMVVDHFPEIPRKW